MQKNNNINILDSRESLATSVLFCEYSEKASNAGLNKDFTIYKFSQIEAYIHLHANVTNKHYALIDKNTSEASIKKLGWELSKYNINLQIKFVNIYLDSFLTEESSNITEKVEMIKDHSTSLSLLSNQYYNHPLTIEYAVNLARIAQRKLSGSKLKVELANLLQRCGMSSYDWNQTMDEIEKELSDDLYFSKNDDEIKREKFDLQFIINEPNKHKQIKLKAKFKRNYKYSESQVNELIDLTNSESCTPKFREFNANEFHNIEIPQNKWLFEGILPAIGVTIVSGLSGVGKTLFGYDCAASLMYNQTFLGQKSSIDNGKVLFVNSTSEMLDHEIQSAFIDRGIGKDTDRYQVILDWGMTDMSFLEDKVNKDKPDLIVMDSFRGITNNLLNFDENSKDAAKPIRQLQALCNKYKIAILLIHHDRKSEDSVNKISRTAGNISITASASAVWNLSKDKEGLIDFCTSKIRNTANSNFKIKLNEENNNRYEKVNCIETPIEEKVDMSLIDSITNLFKTTNNEKLTVNDIAEKLNANRESIKRTLNRYANKGELIRKEAGSKGTKYKSPIYCLINFVNNCPGVPLNSETPDIQKIEASGQLAGHPDKELNCPDTVPIDETLIETSIEESSGQRDNKGNAVQENDYTEINDSTNDTNYLEKANKESIQTRISKLNSFEIKVIALLRNQKKLTYEKIIEKLNINLDNLELVLSKLQQKDIIYYSGNIYSLNPEFDNTSKNRKYR